MKNESHFLKKGRFKTEQVFLADFSLYYKTDLHFLQQYINLNLNFGSLCFSGDVCDDREQLAAIFDEQNGGHYHGGGDGMSSASDSDTKEIMGGATTCSSENLLQV